MDYENIMKCYEVERIMEHRKWMMEIPYLQFPRDWDVKIIPPFAGATIRFKIRKENANVSVYLDCYDNLGCYGEPYWEVYPHKDDVFRCIMADTESLLGAIAESIEKQSAK